ncbi:MAG: YceH family protein [Pseudomonadota bacterium]|nr:YceH family protein [Pseudomonadota bacterium]
MNDTNSAPPQLTAVEARVLGCLIEKHKTTPDQYPLTVNALVLACNQKTNRDPVMDLSPGDVGHCVRELEGRELVERAFGGRVERYEHRFDKAYGLTLRKQAILAMLMLRGPQTFNELLTRCERLADFANVEDVRHTLERMAEQAPALVINMGRAPGQREDRYTHLLSGTPDIEAFLASEPAPRNTSQSALDERVVQLEREVAELRAEMAELRKAFL